MSRYECSWVSCGPPTTPPTSPLSNPTKSEKWGWCCCPSEGYREEEEWPSFLCSACGRSDDPPVPPRLPTPAHPGSNPDVRLRPPPSWSRHGSQQSFQETNRETERRTMPQKVTMTDSRLTEISADDRRGKQRE